MKIICVNNLKRIEVDLVNNSAMWFNPKLGGEKIEERAWQKIAYYFADVEAINESTKLAYEIINKCLAKQGID